MATSQMSIFLQHLRTTLAGDANEVRDGELLNRFTKSRDDAALTALVQRHASLVWGVCCRLLHNRHDAEDAFQATFLVLVRKAATIQNKELVANWLYGVAQQTAVRLKAMAAKQGVRERQVIDMPEPAEAEARVDDLLPLLDQELSRLPEQFRNLIVLCDLEGKTRKEVAQQLGCPEGTIASRLARARAMLTKRFARHGLTVSGAAVAAVLSQSVASASAPACLIGSTIKAASLMAAGQVASSGLISAKVVALTEGVVKAMFVNKIKSVLSAVLVGSMVLGGAGTGVSLSNGAKAVAQSEAKPLVALVAAPVEPPKLEAQKKEVEEKLQQLRKQLQELEARKVAEDKLQQLLKQLHELEAKRAVEAKKAVETPKPALPVNPFQGGGGLQPPAGVTWHLASPQPPGDPAIATLQGLLKSSDPKVVAQAKELLTLLTKKQPVLGGGGLGGGGLPFRFELAPGGKAELVPPAGKPGTFEYELKFDVPKGDGDKPKVVWMAETATARMTTPTAGNSSLKLSSDGKTAAVVSADGTITIYDVASGKEQMKFPRKN
ncbi:MAG: sigma-70 family RNA polymerase sigma factor [Planctomycetes bacterium]|nr:sigma-70 family RNA polymerase sigma factor [Planctomycetota bacterium]